MTYPGEQETVLTFRPDLLTSADRQFKSHLSLKGGLLPGWGAREKESGTALRGGTGKRQSSHSRSVTECFSSICHMLGAG